MSEAGTIESHEWVDVGSAEDFKRSSLREAKLGERLVAVSWKDGRFGVISNVCNHVGGPLGKGLVQSTGVATDIALVVPEFL